MKRKLAAIVLAIAMVFTMMPMTSFNYAYADEAVINFNLTNTDLEWDPVDGAAFYQINIFGQWMQDEDGGPEYYECSFPRKKIDKYIISQVVGGAYEEADTYEITVEAVAGAEDSGLIGLGTFDYPSPVDDEIDNVKVDEYGNLTWDDYYPGTYYVYANDTRITSVYDDCYVDLNGELEYKIQTGILKKASDDSYTIRIDNVVNRDDGEAVVASAELVYTYVTATENPYFENIGWDEGGEYIVWDNAPCAEYIDAYIDGVKIDSFSSWTHIPTLIDKLVRSGKLDNSITDHKIILQAKSYAEGMYHTIYEWSTEYQYLSTEEVLTAFPEDMGIDENGYIQWSYFKDVEYFGYYINDFHNENFISESLYLNDQIDDLIESETITKSENDSYYFKLEALDKDGNVLDFFEDNYTYHSNAQIPSDELYYIEVGEENGGTLYWNKIKSTGDSSVSYDVYVNNVLIGDTYYDNQYNYLNNRIDDLIRSEDIEKPDDNIYILKVVAKWGDWEMVGDESQWVEHEVPGTRPYYYETNVQPAKDTFESVELCLDENDEDHYRQLVWNDIKGAYYYTVEYYGVSNPCWSNSFSLCSEIDQMIEEGRIDSSDTYDVTITAYNDEDEVITTHTVSVAYQSTASVPFKVNINDGILSWQGTEGGMYIRLMVNNIWLGDYISVDAESVDLKALIDQGIINNELDKAEAYSIEACLYEDEENQLNWYNYGEFVYSSSAEPAPLPEITVKLNSDSGIMTWNKLNGADYYTLIVSGCEYTSHWGVGEFDLKDIIDDMIRRRDLIKSADGDYVISLIARADENNKKVGKWEGIFHYDTDAEPIPDVEINAQLDSETGILTWEEVENASYYYVRIFGSYGGVYTVYEGEYPTDDITLKDKVDKLVREAIGFKCEDEQPGYGIEIEAYTYMDHAGIRCGHWSGRFEYASPYDYIEPVYIDAQFDNETGLLTWSDPEGVSIDHYVIYVDNYNLSITDFTGQSIDLNEVLSKENRFDDMETLNIYVEGEDSEGIRVARSGGIEYTYQRPVVELTEDDVYIGSNGRLVANPFEGAGRYVFKIINRDEEGNEIYNIGFSEEELSLLDVDVNKEIDRLIWNDSTFENDGSFDVEFSVLTYDGDLLAKREWQYEYKTDTKFNDKLDSLNLWVENGWLRTDFTDADYSINISLQGDAGESGGVGSEELRFYIAGWINDAIENGKVEEGSNHEFTVTASRDGFNIARGTLSVKCNKSEIPELQGLTYNEEKGRLSWDKVEGADYYRFTINEWEFENWHPGTTSLDVKEKIDSLIRNEYIEKTGSYNIKVEAVFDEYVLAEGSYDLVYDSPATPPVDLDLHFNDGILSWDPVEGVHEYLLYINDKDDSNQGSFYIGNSASVDINRILDMMYTAGDISGDDGHIISVTAYNDQNDPIGIGSSEYTYAPKEYIPQEITGITYDEYGNITWDEPIGATGYRIYINGREIQYEHYGEESCIYNIKEVIDSKIRREEIEASEDDRYDVTIKAFDFNTWNMISAVGSIVIDYDSPATPPVEMTASISDGILAWEPVEGTETYEIGIEDGRSASWINTNDTQIKLDQLIDVMYTEGDLFSSGNYTVRIIAYNNSYDPLGRWDDEYNYSPEEFVKQKISGSKYDSKTGILSWDKVNDASGYSISINGRNFYWADENKLSIDVNRIIDSQIRRERIERPDDNKYEIVINANYFGRYNIADESVVITYDSPARPPAPMTASLDENGILSWEAVEGADHYQVLLGGELTFVSTTELSANLYEAIDNAYTRGWIGDYSDFTFELYAYNDDYEPIGKTEVKVYHTPEEIEETVVKNIDITGYLNEILAGDIVRYDTKIGQTEPANAKIEKTGEGWYYNDIFQEGDDTDRVPVAGDIYKHTIDLYAELGYKFADDLTVTYNGIAVDLGIRRYSDYSLELVRMVEVQPDEANIADADIGIVGGPFTYTGKAITPEVTVIHKGRTLVEGTDYTAAYSENTNVGTATIKITGKGRFTGTESVNFEIGKAKQVITAKVGTVTTKTLAVGKTATITVTGAKGTKSFVSADKTIATVDSKGKITAKKVGTVKITVKAASTSNYNAAASKTITVKVTPAATSSLTASNQTTGVKLTWKKVTGATGYKVYKGSTLIKKITSGSTVTYTYTKANTNGTKYTFKVVPYASTGDGTSKSVITYRLSKPAISSATNSAAGKATVKWGKNTKATGYEIWYSTSKTFSTKKTATITKNTTVSKTLTSLTKGKTYYIKIRSYKTVSGKKYYSAWSAVKTVKITK